MIELENFWNLWSISIVERSAMSDDDCAMARFQDNIKFDDGPNQVTWTFGKMTVQQTVICHLED